MLAPLNATIFSAIFATMTSAVANALDYTTDFWAALSARAGRKPGRIWKYADHAMLDVRAKEDPIVDIGKMCATAVISLPNEDRSQDVVNPEGFDLENYRLNPVVLLDHGKHHALPIGRSEDEDGNLTVFMAPQATRATSYFSQSSEVAEQVFSLVVEKMLRAASVNIIPIVANVRAPGSGGNRPGLDIERCELLEWSWVVLPDNPLAVAKTAAGEYRDVFADRIARILELNKLAGRPLAAPILKTLQPYAPARTITGRGWTPLEKSMSTTTVQKTAEDEEMEKKAAEVAAYQKRKAMEAAGSGANRQGKIDPQLKKDGETDEDYAKRMKGVTPADADGGARTPPGESAFSDDVPKDDEPAAEAPLGSQVLGGIHDHLKDIGNQLEAASKPLENPSVKDYVNTLKDAVMGHLEECKSLHKEQYPEHPELGGDEKSETETSDDDNPNNTPPGATMVKFLARARTQRVALKGLASQLDRLALTKHVNRKARAELEAASRGIHRILKAAESHKEPAPGTDTVPKAQYDALAKTYEKLEAKFEGIVDKLSNMMPARRQ